MTFEDRYASAVRSSNLRGKSDVQGAVDVLGAAGLAAKRTPLGMALERLFVGDNAAAGEIVNILAGMLVGKAWHGDRIELPRTEAADMARAVLAWHRDGVCKPCGGHGVLVMRGTPTLGDQRCTACRGTGRLLFDRFFSMERLHLARWLVAEMEREMNVAGPAAMAALRPKLDIA
ncbi:hypothetical protein [Aquincola tertiaricarbonis]|uniref:hypothetical protein n=1 Tax=Aquincola tertiaricarbonis TaxID=391953 RepID=UPI000615271E|nr:hypothetical protein [Aquincola tertiaricarbonis]